uniref:Uncharacterized protein n=1 Tax=Tetranychus urticae TaxID=32264 RepID=T1K291_TETUR
MRDHLMYVELEAIDAINRHLI